MKTYRLSSIIKNLTYIILTVAIIQQFAIVRNFYLIFQIVIILLTILSFAIYFISSERIIITKISKYLLFLLIYSISLALIGYIRGYHENSCKEIVYALAFITLGFQFSTDDLLSVKICTIYPILCMLMLLSIIFYYGKGFSISSVYIIDEKNQIGAQAGYGILLAIYAFGMKESSRSKKILLFIIVTISIAALLALRSRGVIVALLTIIILFLLKKVFEIKKLIILFYF